MSTVLLLVIILVVLIAAGLLAGFSISRHRRRSARREFGSEFQRVARERGSEKEAEQELRKRRQEVESRIRPLPDDSRQRYAEEWERIERTFVDDPALALEQADRVVTDILAERNFPTESPRDAAEAVGVMHSDVVENYRDAQSTRADATRAGASLQEMRRAIQKYRSVYERLMKE
jgi:hypothetical protein